jgi:ATP-dependent protease ClpP protease subunit
MKIFAKFFFFGPFIHKCNSFMFNMNNNYGINRRNMLTSINTSVVSLAIAPTMTEAVEVDNNFAVVRKDTTIKFYGEINMASCINLIQALEEACLDSKSISFLYDIKPPPIKLYIQSGGGNLMATFGVVDYIKNCDVNIHSYISGYAASSATLIAVSCKKRFISKNSFCLLHQLSGSTSGKFNNIQEDLENMNSFMNTIKDIYINNTKIKIDELDEILSHDVWFTSQKCLELGIVDKII